MFVALPAGSVEHLRYLIAGPLTAGAAASVDLSVEELKFAAVAEVFVEGC